MDSPVTVKAAILQALVREPGFGLQIVERVREQSKGKIVLGQGSTYTILRDLEQKEGLIEGYDGDTMPERGGRPRRYYRLTAAGARVATEQREAVGYLYGLVPA